MRIFFFSQVIVLSALLLAAFYYLRAFQIGLSNIAIVGFNWEAYHAPSYNFALCALVACSLTILLGYTIRQRLPVVGSLMLLLGLVFTLVSAAMLTQPRFINIADVFYYWCAFIASNIILTIWAAILYSRPELLEEEEGPYADVLDYFEQNKSST